MLQVTARRISHVVKSIIVVANVVDDLSIDEVGGDLVKVRVVPRREQLLAVEQPPRRRRLESSLATYQLLAFVNGVHHVIQSTAQ